MTPPPRSTRPTGLRAPAARARLALAGALALTLLAGCTGGPTKATAERPSPTATSGTPASPTAAPTPTATTWPQPGKYLTIADITHDTGGMALLYPEHLTVPKGATKQDVDALAMTMFDLLVAAEDHEATAEETEDDTARRVLAQLPGRNAYEDAAGLKEDLGTGYAMLLAPRVDPKSSVLGTPKIVAQRWKAAVVDGRLQVEARLQRVIPYEHGIGLITNTYVLLANRGSSDAAWSPGYRLHARSTGISSCGIFTAGVMTMGDQKSVREELADYRTGPAGQLSSWSTGKSKATTSPSERRAECRKK